MAASASAAPLAAALPAPSAPPPPIPDECTYKNRLQELTQRAYQKLPIYHTESKGEQHQLKFRSTVEVCSERFSSARCHSRIKDAEQDAARVAYEILVRIDDDDLTDVLGLIDQDVVFCKSILHEFTVKIKATQPTYSVDHPEGLGPMTLFVSSVLFAGNTYTGEAAKSKKDAEQKAARAAIKSILATNNTCMLQIIRSKKRLITAITSSGFNKERGAVSQENHNAPTNALPPVAPIQFVRAVGSSYPTADQGANIIPVADPTAQSVPPVATIQFVRAVGSSYATADQGANISPVADPTAQSVPPVGTIQFARAVGSSYPTADQGANIIPVADPSAQAVPGSKKRKKKRIRGPQATEESVDEQHLTHRNMRFM